MHEGASSHYARQTVENILTVGIVPIGEWLSFSPDLNLTENIWNSLKNFNIIILNSIKEQNCHLR